MSADNWKRSDKKILTIHTFAEVELDETDFLLKKQLADDQHVIEELC